MAITKTIGHKKKQFVHKLIHKKGIWRITSTPYKGDFDVMRIDRFGKAWWEGRFSGSRSDAIKIANRNNRVELKKGLYSSEHAKRIEKKYNLGS